LKEKILDAAEARMIRFGYRKVTMDEIDPGLAVSKNTIYKVFIGKEETPRAGQATAERHQTVAWVIWNSATKTL
jgi:AcrR family transcriptional regulator